MWVLVVEDEPDLRLALVAPEQDPDDARSRLAALVGPDARIHVTSTSGTGDLARQVVFAAEAT